MEPADGVGVGLLVEARVGDAWVLLVALVVCGVLVRLQFGLRPVEGVAWWASTGRDGLNLLAASLLVGALLVRGFRGPAAVVLASAQLVTLALLQPNLGSGRSAAARSVAVSLGLGLPAMVSPGFMASNVERLLAVLF